jgi:small subunit ribosomal protein S20
MAHHKSALKRVRQNIKRRARNRHQRSTLRTTLKGYHELLDAKDAETAEKQFPSVQKVLDKAVTKGVLHRNTAARYKSRLVAALKKVQAA